MEAGLVEEPGGGELDEVAGGGPVGDLVFGEVERGGEGGEGLRGDDGVFEEGAGGAAVGFAGDEEHAFGVADAADGVVDVEGCGWGGGGGEVVAEVGVGEVGSGGGVEAEGDGGDDVAVAVGGVEDAAAVGEVAVGGREGDEGEGFAVEGADVGDGLGDLLTVGADVLDGRAADEAGDAGEALDAGEVCLADGEGEGVPVGAGGDGVGDGLRGAVEERRSGEGDVEDEAGKAGVGDEEVRAAAEEEEGEVVLSGVLDGGEQLGLGGDFEIEAGGAADAEGGERGEGDIVLDVEERGWHGFEGTTGERAGLCGVARGEPVQSEGAVVQTAVVRRDLCIQRLW